MATQASLFLRNGATVSELPAPLMADTAPAALAYPRWEQSLEDTERQRHGRRQVNPIRQFAAELGLMTGFAAHDLFIEVLNRHGVFRESPRRHTPAGDTDAWPEPRWLPGCR